MNRKGKKEGLTSVSPSRDDVGDALSTQKETNYASHAESPNRDPEASHTRCRVKMYTALVPVSSARNLGIVFESNLSFDQHISNVCRSSFYHIRQLRQIRPSLDLNSSIQLANALVSSKLDYCNSLFYGLPDTSIKRLQRVQNSLARVIFLSLNRSVHIITVLI